MHSIANRIRNAFIGSIVVLTVFSLTVLVVNEIGAVKNRQTISTMTTEYSIISLSEDLVTLYNKSTKNPEDKTIIAQYHATHAELLSVLSSLRTEVTARESKLLMVGVERTVGQVIEECDKGLAEVELNEFQNASQHFAQAYKYNDYVSSNVSALLQKELEYLSQNQAKAERIYKISYAVSLLLLLGLILGIILYARKFSKELVSPLVALSVFAEKVAKDTANIPKNYAPVSTEDEIGSLARSVYTMVDKLNEALQKERQLAEEARDANSSVAKNNEMLQKMNALMVGREMKMIELKKEVEELRNKNATSE